MKIMDKRITRFLPAFLMVFLAFSSCDRKGGDDKKADPAPPAASKAPAPVVKTPVPDPKKEIEAFLESWEKAWEARDLEAYLDHYSKTFQAGKRDYEAWKKHKGGLFSRLKSVAVELKDTNITVSDQEATVTFIQDYKDNRRGDYGKKTLLLILESGRWMIVNETWEAVAR
jgi:murein L,D-transpeptidase YafK